MSEIEQIKKLRKTTGAGFKDCNSALKESKGDIDKAIEILRIKGISKASKKMSREANEGVVVVTGNKNKTSLKSFSAWSSTTFCLLHVPQYLFHEVTTTVSPFFLASSNFCIVKFVL